MDCVQPSALAVEQQRVLQAGAGEARVVEAEDERVRPARVPAAADAVDVQAAGPRPAAADPGLARQRREPGADVLRRPAAGAADPEGHGVEFLAQPLRGEGVEAADGARAPVEEPPGGGHERRRRRVLRPGEASQDAGHDPAERLEGGDVAAEPLAPLPAGPPRAVRRRPLPRGVVPGGRLQPRARRRERLVDLREVAPPLPPDRDRAQQRREAREAGAPLLRAGLEQPLAEHRHERRLRAPLRQPAQPGRERAARARERAREPLGEGHGRPGEGVRVRAPAPGRSRAAKASTNACV